MRAPAAGSLAGWWASMPGLRPLLKLGWALQAELGGGPRALHAVNLGLHLANTALAWRLGRRLGFGAVAAGCGAAVFALHPVQTEAVSYLSGRADAQCALGVLAALLLALRAIDRGGSAVPALLAFALALGSKEFALLVPVALLLALRLRDPGTAWRALLRRGRPVLVPLAGGALAALLLAACVPGYRAMAGDVFSRSAAAAGTLLPAQVLSLAWLAGQALGVMAPNADPLLPPVDTLGAPARAALWGGVLALAAAAAWALRSRSRAGAGLLWALLWLAPTHSLALRADAANDRQLYLALLGPAWVLADAVLDRCRGRRPALAALATAGVLLLGTLALQTWQRQAVYASEEAFWRDVLRHAPEHPRALNNLAHALALDCRGAEADALFARAAALAPDDPRPRINRHLLRMRQLPGTERCAAEPR